jgi:cyclic dehypoxanthinyl futalosine synthase
MTTATVAVPPTPASDLRPSTFRLSDLLAKAEAGGRLTAEEALFLYRAADIHDLGASADAVCRRMHGDEFRTYCVERNINYSNVCVLNCKFCGFYAPPGSKKGYVLPKDAIRAKIRELLDIGGTQVLLQGGLHPELPIEWYEDLLSWMKAEFGVHIHGFSPPEIVWFAEFFRMPMRDVIARLRKAGLDSIPGGGGEILVDRVRELISPGKCSADQWLDCMRQAHLLGMNTTATMMFDHIETDAERIEHLLRIRDQQDETGGFTAFIPWRFQWGATPMARQILTGELPSRKTEVDRSPHVGNFEYLRMTALARLFLDNVPHIQSSWVTMGPKVGQMALSFGADDMGSTMMEENVVSKAGTVFALGVRDLRWQIQQAGFTPRQRDYWYRPVAKEFIPPEPTAPTPGRAARAAPP